MSEAREPFWLRHDLHVVAVAAAALAIAWLFRFDVAAPTRRVASGPLSAAVPAAWLADPPQGGALTVRGDDALTRLELRVVDPPPEAVSLDAALELERGGRYGELYQRVSSGRRSVGDKDVLRTVYTYAFKPTPAHGPRVATAIEYAFAAGASGPIYVATVHGGDDKVRDLERRILGSLEVAR